MNVKYDCASRRWVHDWAGVPEDVARRHGYRGLPRPVAPVPRPRWRRPTVRLVHDGRAAAAKAKAERAAASRARQRAYQARYYATHRGLRAKRGAGFGAPGHPKWSTPAARHERRAALSRVRSRAWYAAKRAAALAL
jgi:hypothetical protein